MLIQLNKTTATFKNPSAPALLFVHGAWHGAWCWEPHFLPFFVSKGFDCYTFDLPKHGKKKEEKGINQLRIKDYVNHLERAIDQIDRKIILIGHSMGGYTIQKYLETKDDCQAAILLTSVPGKPIWRLFFKSLWELPLTMMKVITQFDLYHLVNTPEKARKFLFSSNFSKEKVLAYHQLLGPESFKVMVFDFLLSKIKPRKNKELPILVQAAEHDGIVSLSENKYTAILQNADFQLINNIAHDVMLEDNWQQSANYILQWINQYFPATKVQEKTTKNTNPIVFSNAIQDIIGNLPSNQNVEKNDRFNQ